MGTGGSDGGLANSQSGRTPVAGISLAGYTGTVEAGLSRQGETRRLLGLNAEGANAETGVPWRWV